MVSMVKDQSPGTIAPLGSVIEGSLSQGLAVRLHPDVSVEDMRVGKFVVVQGRRSRFFCMLTDVALGTASARILANPPEPSNLFLQEVLSGTGTYGTLNLTPMLMFTPREMGAEGARGQGGKGAGGVQGKFKIQNSKFKIVIVEGGFLSGPEQCGCGVAAG
jgi:hypothetical protein